MDRIYVEIVPEYYVGKYPAITVRFKDSQRHFVDGLTSALEETFRKWARERMVSDE